MTYRNKTTRRKKTFTRKKRNSRLGKRNLTFKITYLIHTSLREVSKELDAFEKSALNYDDTFYIYYKPRTNPNLHPHIHYNSSFAGFPGGCVQMNESFTNKQAYNMVKKWRASVSKLLNADEEERRDWRIMFDHMLSFIKKHIKQTK